MDVDCVGSHLIGVGSHISSPARNIGPESNLLISKLETLTRRCSKYPVPINRPYPAVFSLRIQNVAACPAAYFQPQNSDSSGSGPPLSFSYAFLSFFNSQLGLVLRRRPSSHLLFLIYLFLAFITCLGMSQHFPLRLTGFRNDGHAACK